jgi:hypothetical protein
MKRTVFEQLSEIVISGQKFTAEDILSIKASSEYAECSDQERIFIEELFKDYSERPPHNGIPTAGNTQPPLTPPSPKKSAQVVGLRYVTHTQPGIMFIGPY